MPGKAQVVQLIGGRGRVAAEVSSITLAIDLARRFGTEPHLLFAPAVVDTAQRQVLLTHDDLGATFDMFGRLDIAVLGVGSLTDPTTSRLRYDGVIDDALHADLLRQGAVADVLSYVLNDSGQVLSSGLEDRTISIGLDDLRRTPLPDRGCQRLAQEPGRSRRSSLRPGQHPRHRQPDRNRDHRRGAVTGC